MVHQDLKSSQQFIQLYFQQNTKIKKTLKKIAMRFLQESQMYKSTVTSRKHLVTICLKAGASHIDSSSP